MPINCGNSWQTVVQNYVPVANIPATKKIINYTKLPIIKTDVNPLEITL
jgi:hypothetical protein